MALLTVAVMLTVLCVVSAKPLNDLDENLMVSLDNENAPAHTIQKRFINPSLTSGAFEGSGFNKMRTKRSEDECEKLQLCKLHARSNRNFIAAYELYFVNRENAKLWDHRARSMQECEDRFSCYDR